MQAPDLGRAVGRLSPLALALLLVTLILGTTGGAVAGALITGAQIKNGTVSSIDIKNGSLTGADVKNGSLSGSDLKDESRIFGASQPGSASLNDFTSDAFVPIVSKTFTVRAGYLSISASLFAESDESLGGSGYLQYAIKVDGTTLNSVAYLATDEVGNGHGKSGSISAVVKVSAGTHTISLVARDTATGSFIFERSISAVWTAGGSQSGAPLGLRPAPRSANQG